MATLQERIAAARAKTAALVGNASSGLALAQEQVAAKKAAEPEVILNDLNKPTSITINGHTFDPYYLEGVGYLNKEQREAVNRYGLLGESGCIIGPAGTGKTTTMRALIRAIILSGRVPIIPSDATHKYLKPGLPGIYGGSFTRIATRNLRNNTPEDIKGNIHTIHRVLEFEPDFKEVIDEKTGQTKKIRIFKPTRHPYRPIDSSIQVIILDEASMIGGQLHEFLQNALPHKHQIIYIGDIAQLPPVMDSAVLGFKLLELPVVELTEVYRHAGAIVNLATDIRMGKTIPEAKYCVPYSSSGYRKMPFKLITDHLTKGGWDNSKAPNVFTKEEDGSKVTLQYWKTRLDGEVGQLRAVQNLNTFFKGELAKGLYDPMKDMILIPYNVNVGTIEVNKQIAQFLGIQREATVWEVIAGYEKHYFAPGDKVFFDREESIITEIVRNGDYFGKIPQKESPSLNRWGHNTMGAEAQGDEVHFDSIDSLLNIDIGDKTDEERKNQASHTIKIKKIADIDEFGMEEATEYQCNTAAEVNNLLFGYALTVHKSQGSQWRKVYCVFHNSHNRNLQRELLYTAITRAQKELFVICEPETFIQGVVSQHIIGNTLAEKAEYFKGEKIRKDKQKDMVESINGK